MSLIRAAVLSLAPALIFAQAPQIGSEQLNELRYRYIGPVGNRVIAAAGIPGDPEVYYVGAASGGIFKTTDAGTTWQPIFDSEPVSSVGSLAIAAGDPNLVLGGHRGDLHPQPYFGGRRDLQIDRRGQDLDPHGAGKDRAHRAGADRSAQFRDRAGLRAGALLRAAAGTRRIPHERRGRDVAAHAFCG